MLKSFEACFHLGLILASRRDWADRADGGGVGAAAARKHRAELLERLTRAERGVAPRWGPEAAALARRMATVWLDEILIQAPWPGQKTWLEKPLQSEWGEGRSGGLWFFQQLESLNPARRDDRELAALALRCVSLGLRGCYGRDLDGLDQVRRGVQERFGFQDHIPVFPPPLPPAGRPKAGLASSGLRLLAAVAAVLSILWLAGDFSLKQSLKAVMAEAGPSAAIAPPVPGPIGPSEAL